MKREIVPYAARRAAALLLCLVMALSLLTGCRRREGGRGGETSANGDTTEQGTETGAVDNSQAGSQVSDTGSVPVTGTGAEDLYAEGQTVDVNDIVDTYNVVLVIDTSSSIYESDPHRIALNAPVMFLESMYAGNANQDRMAGAKHANLNIITYNDSVSPCFQQLYTLDDESTVDELRRTLRGTEVPFNSGDTALGDALEQAVEMLPVLNNTIPEPTPFMSGNSDTMSSTLPPPPGPDPMLGGLGGREQNLIILFTDGYSVVGPSHTSYQNSFAGENSGVRNGPAYVSSGNATAPVQQEIPTPYFGGRTQAPLERALRAAKQRQCEILVLGLNPYMNAGPEDSEKAERWDQNWEEFKKIANYTQLNSVVSPPPAIGGGSVVIPQNGASPWNVSGQIGQVIPETPGALPVPPPPMFDIRNGKVGGGMFPSTDSNTSFVNYFQARTLLDTQRFYIQTASAMLQGTGAITPTAKLEGDISRYDCEVKGNGISAIVFYVLSSDEGGVLIDDLIDANGNSWSNELNETDKAGWDSTRKLRKGWYEGCSVITFLSPNPGIWQIKAHTKSGDRSQFSVYMTQIGGIELQIGFKQDSRFADDGKIFLRATYQNQYMPADFYRDVEARCEIMPAIEQLKPGDPEPAPLMGGSGAPNQTGSQSGPSSTDDVKMPFHTFEYDPDSNAMVTVYRADYPGSYTVNATLTASDVDYDKSVNITYEARPSEADLQIRAVRKSLKLSPELSNTWSVIPLEVVSYTWNPRELLQVESEKRDSNVLTVTGLEEGTGTLDIVVRGRINMPPYQKQWTLSYPVTVGRVR